MVSDCINLEKVMKEMKMMENEEIWNMKMKIWNKEEMRKKKMIWQWNNILMKNENRRKESMKIENEGDEMCRRKWRMKEERRRK